MKKTVSLMIVVGLVLVLAGVSSAYDELTVQDIAVLKHMRKLIFGGSKLNRVMNQRTISGLEYPIFRYDATDRAIISWVIDDDDAAGFAAAIGLPPEMSLAKISPLTGRDNNGHHNEPDRYYMLVDIANIEKYVEGAKVEWKTFVTVGEDPTPRIFRFDSQDANPGIDLLDISNIPASVAEWNIEDSIATGVIVEGEHALNISIPINYAENGKPKIKTDERLTEEFLTAGEDVYTPAGSHTRYYFDESSVKSQIVSVKLNDVSIVNTFPWAAYAGELASVTLPVNTTEHLVQPIGSPVASKTYESGLFASLVGMVLGGVDQQVVFQTLSADPNVAPEKFPTMYYGLLDLYQGLEIYAGTELPKMVFDIKKDPMALWVNFEIPEEKVEACKEAFLPDYFELVKMKFYPEQKKAVYALSLNIYEAVGQGVEGFRVEWDTYVINPNEENPNPRFMVIHVETATAPSFDAISALKRFDPADPNNVFSWFGPTADSFTFSIDELDGIRATVDRVSTGVDIDISIAYPVNGELLLTHPEPEWMMCNDYVYWGEVADVLEYDSNMMYANLIVFDYNSSDIISHTKFAEYVNPDPLPIILWNDIQKVAIEGWGNLDDIIVNTASEE